jgi:hypothetical protein
MLQGFIEKKYLLTLVNDSQIPISVSFSPPIQCPTESAVLQTLAYFAVFSHPLTVEEVFAYCSEETATETEILRSLEKLVEDGSAFQFGDFFQAQKDAAWVKNRLEYNRRAAEVWPIAQRMALLIGHFPFVRGVFVSGSLSKHCMRPDSDVDFFVVTASGRLWLARTLLILFKKIFLLNSHKYFCINYLVDVDHLEIEEKNLFTATESVTLLPMWGSEFYVAFCQKNAWAWQYYPHSPYRSTADVPAHARGFFKKGLEKVLAGKLGTWLDHKLQRLTVRFWKKKFRHLDNQQFELALKSRRRVSKHHPQHFQEKVLERFEAQLQHKTLELLNARRLKSA